MNLPPKNNQLVIGVGLIVGMLIFYQASVRPSQTRQASRLERQLRTSRNELSSLEREVDALALESMRMAVEDMKEELSQLGLRLLPRDELLVFVDNLAGLVEERNIDIEFVQLKQLDFRTEDVEVARGTVLKGESFPLEMRMRGESREFASYLWVLERLPQIIRAERISVMRSAGSNMLEIVMTVVIPAGLVDERSST